MSNDPRAAALATEQLDPTTPGPGERFAGYGVMGLPFASGHYLALRRFPANPFGHPYHAVWHRDPDGRWLFYVDAPADASCPRYFDAAIEASVLTRISVSWPQPHRLEVRVGDTIDWTVDVARTPATALMTGAGRVMPQALWDSRSVLSVMGRMAAPVLRVGRIRLSGGVPNGQWFTASPRLMWRVADSAATVAGVNIGRPGRLGEQAHLGGFWLPQRGMFVVGGGRFEELDPDRHRVARPALTETGAAITTTIG
jgi:hypothetical protein